MTRYDYAFDLATASARSRLTVDVAAPGGDCFSAACGIDTVAGATFAGDPAVSSEVALGALEVCGAGVPGGTSLEIGADVTVPEKTFLGLDVGFSRTTDMAGDEFSYLLSWVGGCDHFGPCDDDPSKLVEIHVEVTHPAGTTVLCPSVRTPGATTTRCDLAGTLAPTYSGFALAADPAWVETPFLTVDGVDMVFFEVPGGQIAANLEKPSVTAFFQWLTGLLGPYPYGSELRFAGGPTAWLGFEHPANIILYEKLPSVNGYENTTMHVFMHEIIHQWAGDRTTIATAADFVWKEATAEYLSYVFEDEQRPPAEAAASLAYWDTVSLQSDHYPRPTDDPTPPVEQFYGDVYGPGPMVLYVQLETMLGRQAVLDGIASFLSTPGARTVTELRTALETASGKDLAAYFDAWVFGKGAPEWPTMTVTASQAGDQVTVTVTQSNASQTLYGCAVEVQVNGATQSATALVDFGVAPSSASASATVTLAEPVVSTQLDPGHRVVAREPALASAPAPELPVYLF